MKKAINKYKALLKGWWTEIALLICLTPALFFTQTLHIQLAIAFFSILAARLVILGYSQKRRC